MLRERCPVHWFSEIVSLYLLASDLLQEFVLLTGLNALGKRLDSNFLRHIHDRRDDVSGFFCRGTQKAHIDLQLIKIQVLQRAQRRISGAEIVHPDLKSQLMETADILTQPLRMADECALCDLKINELTRNLIFFRQAFYSVDQIRLTEILAGKIHRYRHDIHACLDPFPAVTADLFEHKEIEISNSALILQSRYKLSGRDHPVYRILPPAQCLCSAELSRDSTHHRLVIDLNPALSHCPLIVLQQILLPLCPDQHLLIEIRIGRVCRILQRIARKLRTVNRGCQTDIITIHYINANGNRTGISPVQLCHILEHAADILFQLIRRRACYKVITVKSCRIPDAEPAANQPSQSTDQGIARLKSVQRLIFTKSGVIHPQNCRNPVFLPDLEDSRGNSLKKLTDCRQARQIIKLIAMQVIVQ